MERNIEKKTLQQMPSSALQKLLKKDFDGTEALSAETILLICEILSNREHSPDGTAVVAWNRLQTLYIDPMDK